MSTQKEKKLLYKALLPEHFRIQVHKADEGGYWAKTLEIPCYSQGETFSELFDVLTKAIYAYYDIPEKFISEFGTYLPVHSVRESFNDHKPKAYTLDDILQNYPEKIQELQLV